MSKRSIIKKLVFGLLCLGVNMLNGQVLGGYLELDRNVNTVHANAAILFRCCPLPTINYLKINWGDGSPQDSIPLNYPIPQFVPSGGYIMFYFSGSHTYIPGAVYSVTAGGIYFASGFQNIPNSSSQELILRGILNMQVFASPPISTLKTLIDSVHCAAIHYDDYASNPGMLSKDGDSLVSSIELHPEISGYIPPPISVNPVTGLMSFTANASGDYNVSYRTDAWRKSVINGPYDINTGTSFFELYVPVCNIYLPSATGIESARVNADGLLEMFPNPTNNIVTGNIGIQGVKQVSLTNAAGQLLMNKQELGGQFILDVSEYNNGVYILYVRTEEGLITRKIVKN
jgi:hypothetical protein